MNGSLKTLVSIHLALFIATALFGQNKGKKAVPISFPFTEKHWSAKTDNVAFVDHKSTMAVKSSNDEGFEILLKDFDFSVGTIEFDVELKGRGFPGIKFHVDETTGNSETFYLRYFGTLNPISRNTTQYAAVIDGVNLWDLTDDYQAAATVFENQWNHIKMVISKNQMKVYVNDMQRAALHVPVLEGLTKSGKISLSGNVIYANMKITPDTIGELPDVAGYDPTYNDPNYLRNWKVLEPIDFPTGKDIMQQINTSSGVVINEAYFDDSKEWKPITAEHRAMVNLTKAFGGTERNSRRLTWLKTSITSDKELEKLLKLGFSDEVWVFINGQPLYQDKNYYGSPGMKEPRGRCTTDNTSLRIPLVEGENEILIGLTSYFFGWGLVARWDDTSGLRY
ncbi:hypothetical protein [Allomuricauda sp. d1]|uniref:hypothetical protein n=1 Tax=Allomuricauda sp. d1 TaxID=3136725 RepID=UPI0031D47028